MSLEQRILDALNEAPASKSDLVWSLDAKPGTMDNAIRRLVTAKEIELVREKAGVRGLYRALVTHTSIRPRTERGVTSAKVWNPLTDPKPDFLRRYRGREG